MQAAERFRITWSAPTPLFPEPAALHDHIGASPIVKRGAGHRRRNPGLYVDNCWF
jgi:hypothetical protein